MHISSTGEHVVAGERKWLGNLRGQWQTGGVHILCLLINGVRVSKYTWTPPFSPFSCLSTTRHGWMRRFSTLHLKKRLSHKILLRITKILGVVSLVTWVWFIHLLSDSGGRKTEGKKKGKLDTNSLLSMSSLTCHRGHTEYYRGVWEESYWSNCIVLQFITTDCSQRHTHRETITTGHAKGHLLMELPLTPI